MYSRLHVKCLGVGCTNLISDELVEKLASPAALAKREANRRDANKRRLEGLAMPGEADADPLAFHNFCVANTRKCPRCAVIIFRDAGCNHMSCKCGARDTYVAIYMTPTLTLTLTRRSL